MSLVYRRVPKIKKRIAVSYIYMLSFGVSSGMNTQAQRVDPPSTSLQALSPEMQGDLLIARGQYQAAIDAYRSTSEESAVISNKIGIAYLHLHAVDEAKSYFLRALRLKGEYPDALNNLGAAFHAQKQYRQAEKLYKRAIKLAPRDATFRKNLGEAYWADGKVREALEEYRTAFSLNPEAFGNGLRDAISEPAKPSERARQDYCFAAMFAQAGMTQSAIDYLRRAIDLGFSDYRRLMRDQQFAELRKTTEFSQLMAEQKHP
jgi:tetratricopeptide (TPR) repeat protein